jgi:hypothetical protein
MPTKRSIMWLWVAAFLAMTPGTLRAQAVEPFDYPPPSAHDAAGGAGWSGPWRGSATLTRPTALPIIEGSLDAPTYYAPVPSGARLAVSGETYCRGLALGREIDLSAQRPIYLSFLAKRRATADGKSRSFYLTLMDRLDAVLSVGHSSSGRLVVHGVTSGASDRPLIADGHTYLWVVRITAPDRAGQRRAVVYLVSADQAVDATEPTTPHVVSEPFASDAVIDRLSISAGGDVTIELDELRVGPSWRAVTRGG